MLENLNKKVATILLAISGLVGTYFEWDKIAPLIEQFTGGKEETGVKIEVSGGTQTTNTGDNSQNQNINYK
jgi:hypothetical protein